MCCRDKSVEYIPVPEGITINLDDTVWSTPCVFLIDRSRFITLDF